MAILFVTLRVAFQRSHHWRKKYLYFFSVKNRCVHFLLLKKKAGNLSHCDEEVHFGQSNMIASTEC